MHPWSWASKTVFALCTIAVVSANVAMAAPDGVGADQPTPKTVVASGDLGLEEFETTMKLNVNVSQSRLFQIQHRITRVSVADPGIAEPVVIAENQFLILGKAPAETSIAVWDDKGDVLLITVHVSGADKFGSTMSALHDVLCSNALGLGPKTRVRSAGNSSFSLVECKVQRDTAYYLKRAPSASWAPYTPKPFKSRDSKFEVPVTMEGGTVICGAGTETCKTAKTITLFSSQSRIFKTKNGLAKEIVGDPGISEPIAIGKHLIVVLGKAPGQTQLILHDDLGNIDALNLLVRKNSKGVLSSICAFGEAWLHRIVGEKRMASVPYVDTDTIDLREQKMTQSIGLRPSQTRLFDTENAVLRTTISDPGVVEPVLISSTQIALVGKRPGKTTLFIWDECGSVSGIDLHVGGQPAPVTDSNISSADILTPAPTIEIECWSGSRKDLLCEPNDSKLIGAENRGKLSKDWLRNLNNSAVKALAMQHYQVAIDKLLLAIKIAPYYTTARNNLGVAYNNYGLTMQKNPELAIKYFHAAVYYDPNNLTSDGNLTGIINAWGKDQNKFEDRVALGDDAKNTGDIVGSIIEYRAALKIHDDAPVRDKLDQALKDLKARGMLEKSSEK